MPSRSRSRSRSPTKRRRSRSRSRSPRRDYGDRSNDRYDKGRDDGRRSPYRARSRSPGARPFSSSAAAAIWQEERRKLRMERPALRTVWERSPTPPRGRYGEDEDDKKKPAPGIRQRDSSPKKASSSSSSSSSSRPSAMEITAAAPNNSTPIVADGNRKQNTPKSDRKDRKKRRSRSRSPSPSDSSSSSSSSSSDSEDRKRRKKHRKQKKEKRSSIDKTKPTKEKSPVAAVSAASLFPVPSSLPTPTTTAAAAIAASASPTTAAAIAIVKGSDDAEAIRAMQEVAAAAERKRLAANPSLVGGVMANEEDDVVGPRPLPKIDPKVSYGGSLLAGEGDAMARFVQDNKRIPRRGEIGLTSDEISKYEEAGFVMSGSRHRRMNAVRMRKEAQVYGAEEQKMLAMLNFEEKVQKETKVLAGFRQMLATKLSSQQGTAAPTAGASVAPTTTSAPQASMNPTSPVSGGESDKSK